MLLIRIAHLLLCSLCSKGFTFLISSNCPNNPGEETEGNYLPLTSKWWK